MNSNLDWGIFTSSDHQHSIALSILDKTSIVIIALRENGDCILINSAGRRFLNISDQFDSEDLHLSLIPGWELSGLAALIRLAFETKAEQRIQITWPLDNGNNLWLDVYLIPYTFGEDQRIVVVLEDKTLSHLLNEGMEQAVKDRVAALHDSEARYAFLSDSIPDLILSIDSTEHIIYANFSAGQFLHKPIDEIIGQPISHCFPPISADFLVNNILHVFSTGEPTSGEQNLQISREKIWFSIRCVPVKNKTGQVISCLVIIRDINTTKLAEAELIQSRYMLNLILDTVPQRVFWKDRESRYLGFNRAFALDQQINDPSSLIGKTDEDLSWKENASQFRNEEKAIFENDTPRLDFEELRRMPEGHMLWVRTSLVPLHDSQSKIFGILGTYSDITEEKWMEAHFKENELRFRSTFDQAAVGIAHITPKDRFIIVNQRLCEISGYSGDEMLQLGLEDLTHPDERARIHELLANFNNLENEGKFQEEVKFIRKNGEVVWVQLSASVVINPQGIIQYWVAVIEDISQRKRATELLALRTYELGRSNQLIASLSEVSARLEPTRDPLLVMETLGKELKKLRIYIQVATNLEKDDQFELSYSSISNQQFAKLMTVFHIKMTTKKFRLKRGISKEIIDHKRPVFLINPSYFVFEGIETTTFNQYRIPSSFLKIKGILLPLQIGEKLIGILALWGKRIEKSDIYAFSVFANQVAAALEASRLYQEIANQAIRDELTGLLNRRGFFTLGEQQLRLQARFEQYLNLIYVDLDHFKSINDRFGHQVGDQALINVADILKKCFRNADIIGRLGGDEFVVLTIEKRPSDPHELRARLEERFKNFNSRHTSPYTISFSAGFVSCELSPNITLDDWLKKADENMYQNKRENKL